MDSNQKHTPEPWKVLEAEDRTILIVAPWSDQVSPGKESGYGDYRGLHIASCEHQEDNPCVSKEAALARMRRIVACVNACAGIDTGTLEAFPGSVPAVLEFYKLTKERDELAANYLEQAEAVARMRKQRDELMVCLADARNALLREGMQRDELLAAIELYEQALKASWPDGAMGDAFDYWNAARGKGGAA